MKDTEFDENRYLWDHGGTPDIEVARLEKALAPLRYRGPRRTRQSLAWIGAAAAVAAIAALLLWMPRANPSATSEHGWTLARGDIAAIPIHPGAVIETVAGATVELHSRELGMLRVDPQSRLRLLSPRSGQQRFALDYGTLRAYIVAPPAKLAVNTPGARAVDLGCVYTLQSGKDGNGLLTVEVGWVALEAGDRESFIPAGASSRIREQGGPGVPVYADAPPTLREAALRFDAGDSNAVGEMLRAARTKDALTLWHMLQRAEPGTRTLVAKRFSELVRLPETVALDDLAAVDRAAMDAAWNALDLGDTSWWRTWKRSL